ncbi:hypothetical protein TWF694_010158 [Orbilia ellipsospora]|uniref:Uncharacterized protein n=1 Tax=Orbilia ellipsospora TaxID=2528407 RepID=A0AAV9X933_9PEZI
MVMDIPAHTTTSSTNSTGLNNTTTSFNQQEGSRPKSGLDPLAIRLIVTLVLIGAGIFLRCCYSTCIEICNDDDGKGPKEDENSPPAPPVPGTPETPASVEIKRPPELSQTGMHIHQDRVEEINIWQWRNTPVSSNPTPGETSATPIPEPPRAPEGFRASTKTSNPPPYPSKVTYAESQNT